jgi:hypothetical protein
VTSTLSGTTFVEASVDADGFRIRYLEAPADIVPDSIAPPPNSPEELRQRLYAHPERLPRTHA